MAFISSILHSTALTFRQVHNPATGCVAALTERGVAVTYQPQRDELPSPALGGLNGDGCVDRSDLALIMGAIRLASPEPPL